MKTESKGGHAWAAVMRRVVALGLIAVVVTLPLYGWQFASSVAVGAAVAAANLWMISRAVTGLTAGGNKGALGSAYVLKFSVVIAGLYLLFDSRFVQGLPLLMGLAVLPIGILVSQVSAAGSLREG